MKVLIPLLLITLGVLGGFWFLFKSPLISKLKRSTKVISYFVFVILVFVIFKNFNSYLLELTNKQLDNQIRNELKQINGIYKFDMQLANREFNQIANISFYLNTQDQSIMRYNSFSFMENNPSADTKQFGLRNYYSGGYIRTVWDGRFENLIYIDFDKAESKYRVVIGIESYGWDKSGNINRVAFGEDYAYLLNRIYVHTDVITARYYSFFDKVSYLLKSEELNTRDVFNSSSLCGLKQYYFEKKLNDKDFKRNGDPEVWIGEISINKK
jgi:hypothetical protein